MHVSHRKMSKANHDFDLLKLLSLIGFSENESTKFQDAMQVLEKASSTTWRSILSIGVRHYYLKSNDVDFINKMNEAATCIDIEHNNQQVDAINNVGVVDFRSRVLAIKELKYKIISYCDDAS